jgi:aldose 1-epimerase
MDALTYSSAALEVVVLPDVGARMHRLRAFGQDLLRTPDQETVHEADPFFWGAYVMAPWCNRLEAGPIRFGTRQIDLPLNFPDGSAIHGQVYARPWQVEEDGRLTIRGGGDTWPWRYQVDQRLTVSGAELRIELELTNRDDEPMPAGLGIHPWFRRPLRAAIRGGRVFPNNLDSSAGPQPVEGELDLRAIGDVPDNIDATWTDLSDPAVELVWSHRVRATMRVEVGFSSAFIVSASPTSVDAIAIEPQTHAPHGLSRLLAGGPGGLAMLPPHKTLTLVMRLAIDPLSH